MVGTEQERNEKAEAALKQLLTCARADCPHCQLVPEPEQYQQCLGVMETCEEILREACGLPAEDEQEGDEDGAETE